MAKFNGFESAIRASGGVKIGEFTTRAGMSANCKIEIDNEFLMSNPELAHHISANLAEQVGEYEPSLIIPVPTGANYLGELVAKHLSISYLAMDKKEDQSYSFRSKSDRLHISRMRRIAIVDDVYTTGSAIRDISATPEVKDKVVVAGVIWDRSDSALPKNIGCDLVSVVKRFIPLRVEEVASI